MRQSKGYFRFPAIFKDQIVFVSEDDLWSVKTSGGKAVRLTANVGQATNPSISDDGKLLAFVGSEEGNPEVYVMSAEGGAAQRLTYLGGICRVIGWYKGEILFFSNHAQPFRQNFMIYSLPPDGGEPKQLAYGLATSISFGKKGVVIGRKATDPATWKRYRGGTAGELWVDETGKGKFQRLIDRAGNYSNPMWIGNRIYFISDLEGVSNIYSVKPDGSDLKKHTSHKEYFVRNAATDGRSIVYQAGADIYIFDPKTGRDQMVKIEYHSPYIQRERKFASASDYLEDCDLHPQGKRVIMQCRGKFFNLDNWQGGTIQCGKADGVRYRLTRWLNDGQRGITVSDEGGEEQLEIYDLEKNELLTQLKLKDIGRFIYMDVSPEKNRDVIVFANHRNELYWLDLKKKKPVLIAKNQWGDLSQAAWSPDGKWIAYANNIDKTASIIMLYELEKGKSYPLTKPVLMDGEPCFSQDGKYLYLVSYRVFNPVYDVLHFDLSFTKGSLIYVIPLTKDAKTPFEQETKGFKEITEGDSKKAKTGKKETETSVKIDLTGIEERLVALPLPEDNYYALSAAGDRVFYLTYPVFGVLDDPDWMNPKPKAVLKYFDLQKQKEETLITGISGYRIAGDGSALVVVIGKKVRIIPAVIEPNNLSKEQGFNKETGWIDLNRIKISVDPVSEWKQMFVEAWRLQRDYFWVENMSDIDWKKVFKRYYPLLERIATRSEFADLIWEMQGELGTSHAYEFGGDYKKRPHYQLGLLGADLLYDEKNDCYLIKHIVEGDVWDHKNPPPLKRPGLNIKPGMQIKAVNGIKMSKSVTPERALVNFASQEVQLTIAGKDGKNERQVTVKTLGDDRYLRYREWVENNKQYVHKKSKGKVGYIHIPDMMGEGYAEFHRHFLTEYDYEGLIIDVRYNGGGHVSQLLLEKLARRRIGYNLSRWYGEQPYPEYSVKGPMVALTNEFAGSDGDIFSHCFKLMKLGTLIGKRTWGGVIGINPRNRLVDGGITTQPEFSFWFKDVGWSVENYGTDPDIEVDFRPQDYTEGKDPQLDKALEVIKKEMKEFVYLKPDFGNKPKLKLP
jgi:tricorn protease